MAVAVTVAVEAAAPPRNSAVAVVVITVAAEMAVVQTPLGRKTRHVRRPPHI